MRKLTTTIIGLSLLAGSALTAQDNFEGFYPIENDDTPSYILSNNNDITSEHTSIKLPSNTNTFVAFYPVENNDSPDYVNYSKTLDVVSATLSQSGISHCTLSSFYPEDNLDTRLQTSC